METLHLLLLVGIVGPAAFYYLPSAFLATLSIWALQQFFLHENLLRTNMVEAVVADKNRLPSRAQFLRTQLRPLVALVYDKCIICHDQPTSPVQTPCQHIFCQDCFMRWINRNHRRCPQCTKSLFLFDPRALEKAIKLCIAAHIIGTPLTWFHLVFSEGRRLWLVFTTLMTVYQGLALLNAFQSSLRHGGSWWKRVFPNVVQDAARDERETEFFEWLCRLQVAWAVYQAYGLDAYLPQHYLRKVLSAS